MYKLFVGFRKLGEFPSISEAKKFADQSGYSGVFILVGEDYRDSWFIFRYQKQKRERFRVPFFVANGPSCRLCRP